MKYNRLKGNLTERMRQKLLAGPKNGPYTLKEVSYRLNISDATLKRRIKEGKLKAYKSDGKLMVNKPDLEQFINDFPKYNPNKMMLCQRLM